MFDIFGLGNPMVDAIIQVEEDFIKKIGFPKGSMNLINEQTSKNILKMLEKSNFSPAPAGDVVNTIMGIANLGGKAVFCGKIGNDKNGLLIESIMNHDGIKPVLIKGSVDTGTCISLVTPDYERTMLTNLGAAITLNESEVVIEDIKNSKILYVTGYILEDPNLRKAALIALNEAKKYDKEIVIDVSDPNLVLRCKEDLLNIIKEFADILIANEDEAFALTGEKRIDALNAMHFLAKLSIIKIGKEGALVNDDGDIFEVKGFKVNAIDTTGAGDMFAAGFLFGLTNGYDSKQSALIANFAASKVVEVLGGRLNVSLKEEVKKLLREDLVD